MQTRPTEALAHVIKHYITIECDSPVAVRSHLIPDGNPGIVFQYGRPFYFEQSAGMPSAFDSNAFIYGQMSRFCPLFSKGSLGLFVIVLQPYALKTLFHLSASHLTNKTILLQQFWGAEAGRLEMQVSKARNNASRIKLIEEHLLNTLRLPLQENSAIRENISWINACCSEGHISEMLKLAPVGARQLERIFKEHVGLSPKAYAGVVRIQHLLRSLSNEHDPHLTGMAYSFGYYDQAHCIKDFQQKCGMSPKKYLKAQEYMALNFIQLPG